ncbi:MAG TPA: oligoendopeptidase F [Chthoniobacterales bacterium]
MIFAYKNDPPDAPAKTPLRSQIPVADTWDLSSLYVTDADWEAAFEKLQADYPALKAFRGRVGESAETLLELLEAEKQIEISLERLGHFSMLRASEDSSDNANLARRARLQNIWTLVGEATAFVVPEIVAIDDAVFAGFLKSPGLASWATKLSKIRRYRPHTLSPSEERLLALAGNALHGHSETFSQLTNVDMKFGSLLDDKGVERELTQSSFSSFLYSPAPEVRKNAFHQFYREFEDHQFTVAATLASSVRTDVFQARARNYPSAREASLFHDAVPVSVYDNLISTVRANLPALHEYYEFRREHLGLAEIHHYDTYVPLVSEIRTNVSFDEAIEKVIASLAPLGSEYTSALANGFATRWCDRYESKGKRSGAFSSSSYGNPPFILMNYKADVFSDVYTLAHEAGHSMHSWFSQGAQTFQDYDYPIFLAEVASTFNENLLTHHLLAQTDDPKMRAYILNRQIEDLRGTLYRQTMFAEFEKIIHGMEESGEALTLEAFKSAYHGLLTAYFGDKFTLDPQLDLECLRIPHFYSAFYVYKYATGISAATALSSRVLTGEKQELADYLGFLKSGGSKYPLDTLRAAGVDIEKPEPVRAALDLFRTRVAELRELL